MSFGRSKDFFFFGKTEGRLEKCVKPSNAAGKPSTAPALELC